MNNYVLAGLSVAAGIGISTGALAVTIPVGLYTLGNHPDGNQSPPPYGLRLDGLLGNGSTSMTFDFDTAGAAMFMEYNGTSLHIWGTAFGGVDVGGTYSSDPALTSFITVDFTYSMTSLASGDDDLIVTTPDFTNSGKVTWLDTGDVYDIFDYSGSKSYTFRLGDESSNGGHRGYNGISGWGWVNHGPEGSNPNDLSHISASDWLFIATPLPIPMPAPAGMAMLGLAGLAIRRRRSIH